ncbi:MAG: putative membrane protein [Bermanella sp.]|jgi:putative membrane protein
MKWLATFLKGMAMGAADVVPGVSGGTVALIAGIYAALIDSIRAFDLELVGLLLKGRIQACWQKVNGNFLLPLVAGIACSLFSLAKVISLALEQYPTHLYAFFIGLILASAVLLLRDIHQWRGALIASLLLGALLMLGISELRPMDITPSPIALFSAGAIAICAMILPGISGSFLLLIMGVYPFVLTAVHEFEITNLAIFASGCAVGLLSFVRLLSWLLLRYRDLLMSCLIGVLFASLKVLWPWQPSVSPNAPPPADLAVDMASLLAGILIVVAIHFWAGRKSGQS